MWTIAAPACAASIAPSAICSGATGTSSERSVVAPTPVTGQVMKTSVFTLRLYDEVDACAPGTPTATPREEPRMSAYSLRDGLLGLVRSPVSAAPLAPPAARAPPPQSRRAHRS